MSQEEEFTPKEGAKTPVTKDALHKDGLKAYSIQGKDNS